MRRDDHAVDLDGLLADWHRWASRYTPMTICRSSPMFHETPSGKGYETQAEIEASAAEAADMEAVDFQVSEMHEPHRTAIHVYARNCCVTATVWSNPRLPDDQLELARITNEALEMLAVRLMGVSVL